jgi:L-serine dehydratase
MYRSLAAAVRDAEARGITLSRLALETESEDQGRPVGEIRDVLKRALFVMQGAVRQGLAGDLRSASGLVGGDAAKLVMVRRARSPARHSATFSRGRSRSKR